MDILEWLRSNAMEGSPMREAADEIERLRERVAELQLGETSQRMARVDASLAKQLSTAMAENARLRAALQEIDR